MNEHYEAYSAPHPVVMILEPSKDPDTTAKILCIVGFWSIADHDSLPLTLPEGNIMAQCPRVEGTVGVEHHLRKMEGL